MSHQTQIHKDSLMMLLGAMPVPERLYEPKVKDIPKLVINPVQKPLRKFKGTGARPIDIRCREIREEMKNLLLNGHSDSKHQVVYDLMKTKNLLTMPNEQIMKFNIFQKHYGAVRASLGMAKLFVPGKREKIIELFDSGITEKDINKKHGFIKEHVYTTLVKAGRITRRKRFNANVTVSDKSIQFTGSKNANINRLFDEGHSVETIGEMLTTRPSYVRECLVKSGKLKLAKPGGQIKLSSAGMLRVFGQNS